MNIRQNLPSLSAVRAFEAVARLASFKDAARELFVTPTAISHQIRQIEDHLGVRLIVRSPRPICLTPDGKILFEAATTALDGLSRAATRIQQRDANEVVTLSSTAAFLSQWLVPRLSELRSLLPTVDIRFHAADAVVDLRRGEVDLAVRYGKGPFVGGTLIREDTYAPVCSPRLGLTSHADLEGIDLIHIDGRTTPLPPPDWRRWCLAAGIELANIDAGPRFTNGLNAVQAAIAAQGVVLVSLLLAADAIGSGLLVQPFETVLPGAGYHVVCAPHSADCGAVAIVKDWLIKSVAASY
ncbi:LysR family glycine cleavage system transcriptional activator [Sphingomonas sp. UYAg733]